MKKRQAFLLAAVLFLILFVSGLSVQSHRLLPSPKLHELLVQKIQNFTDGILKYQSARVGYFPQPKIIFERPQLVFSDRSFSIEAEKVQFDFNVLPLLFGRVEPAAFYAQAGKAELSLPGLGLLNPLRFENFSLQIGAVSAKAPIPFRFTSDMGGKSQALVIKGNVALDSVEQWNWEKTSGYMAIELKGLALETMAKQTGADSQPLSFLKAGQVDTSVEIKKKAQEAFLELTAIGAGKGLSYEIPQDKPWVAPPPLDVEWNVAAAWNNDTTELKLHKATIKLPFGSVEANGGLKAGTGEIMNVYIAGSNMALEDLLKYWPGLENALPFHIGFSGPGKWVLSTEGTLDHLSLHFAWDLAQVLLSYGQYFSKPKDIPLDLTLDLLLQKGALLGGDFAVKFKEMSMKGNLKDLDLKSGEGQLNLITNKFSMTGWEQFIPALQRYKLEGSTKLMANWKGDLRKLEKAERIFNATFDKASWITPAGLGVRNASLVLDYSPLMMEGRQMQFEIGGFPVIADLKISELSQKPKVETKISSGELKLLQAWREITALFQRKAEGAGPDSFDHIENFIENLLPENEALRNILAEVRCENDVWSMPLLQFESYGGKADLRGSLKFKDKEPDYQIEGGFLGLDLGLFLQRRDAAQRVLEGTLDLKGSVQGTGWGFENENGSFAGQGEFTLTNGKFLTFDFKDALSTIDPFRNLGAFIPTMRDFDTMNFYWKVSERKVATDNLLVKHGDYVIDGEGTLGFDGIANFRADVFLSGGLAAALLPEMAKSFNKNPHAHLGPIATLISGSLLSPEVKPDPVQAAELTEKIYKGKTKEILYELVLE
jgi:hypothetical protein